MTKYTPINGWTKEKMLAQIEKYLPADGSKCLYPGSSNCTYHRPTDNRRCSVGAFLPGDPLDNTEYTPWFGYSGGVCTLLHLYPELEEHMPLERVPLHEMQLIHDATYFGRNAKQAVILWIEECVE